jgi:hypothetical protein
LPEAVFFDTVRVYYQYLANRKLEKQSKLQLANNFLSPLTGSSFKYEQLLSAVKTDSAEKKNIAALTNRKNELENWIKANELKQVVVTARKKTPLQLLDERYTTGLFAGDYFKKQFDVSNDLRTPAMSDIFQYLQGQVAGLQILQIPLNLKFVDEPFGDEPVPYTLTWRGDIPDLFLDEVEIRVSDLAAVGMNEIAYVKVFAPIFNGSGMGTRHRGAGGAIAVYTKRRQDIYSSIDTSSALNYQRIAGYAPFKQFYTPDVSGPASMKADGRTTIYWNPYIITNAKNRTAQIEFYNNSISKKLRVVVEGIDETGNMTRAESILE